MTTRTSRVALAALVAGLALLTSLATAGAHANVARSLPAADARLSSAPTRVEVWFTEDLFRRAGANGLAVTGPDGLSVDGGETEFDAADRRHMTMRLQPGLGPGVYTVAWSTLSIDGDSASGRFSFTVDPNAAATPAPEASSPAADAPLHPLLMAAVLGGAVALAAAAIALFNRPR